MNALTVLFCGSLAGEALEPLSGGKSAFDLALERAAAFPGTKKLVLFGGENTPGGLFREVIRRDWTVSALLESLSREGEGFDLTYFAWADSPFLDAGLAGKLAERHLRYSADYSYADGWPYGIAPELLAPGSAGILYKIAGEAAQGRVERDTVFAVLQKDINAFDIETEISSVDLRCHRLNLCADSRRNLLLVRRFADAGLGADGADTVEAVETIAAEKPELFRTLPAFFSVQIAASCPPASTSGETGSCAFCPYQASGQKPRDENFLPPDRFAGLLDKIEAFAGDAVIDLSAWGEPGLHPEFETLAGMVLDRHAFSLLVETSGLGWKAGVPEWIAEKASGAARRLNGMAPVAWIVSLNERDLPTAPAPNAVASAACENGAASFALLLAGLFPKAVYVQAVRTKGAEDAIEQFYRAWKSAAGPQIIIQKYNDFCKALPERNAVDLSPVRRRPCWHVMRDFVVLIDGGVPCCLNACPSIWNGEAGLLLGNAFTESLETVWERGTARYLEHCKERYGGICAGCDEYYTYNF